MLDAVLQSEMPLSSIMYYLMSYLSLAREQDLSSKVTWAGSIDTAVAAAEETLGPGATVGDLSVV